MFVRLALASEIEAIVEMARANWAATRSEHEFDEDMVRSTCYEYLSRANPILYVVDDNRIPIGFLLVSLNRFRFTGGHYMAQEVLYVQPDKRGTRAAALLMEHLLAEADRLGAKEIVGGNDNGFNSERTARFLEHFGFKRVGFSMRRLHGQAQRRQ